MKSAFYLTLLLSLALVGCAKPKAESQSATSASKSQQTQDDPEESSFVNNFELNEGLQDFSDRFSNMTSEEMVSMIEDQVSSLLGRVDEFVPRFWQAWNDSNGSVQALIGEFLDSSGQIGKLLSDAKQLLQHLKDNQASSALIDRVQAAIGGLNLSNGTLGIIGSFLKKSSKTSNLAELQKSQHP